MAIQDQVVPWVAVALQIKVMVHQLQAALLVQVVHQLQVVLWEAPQVQVVHQLQVVLWVALQV